MSYQAKYKARKMRKYVKSRRPVTPAIKKAVKSVLDSQTETKRKITTATEVSDTTLVSPNTIHTMNALTNGTEENNRIGSSVHGRYMNIRGQIQSTHQEAIYHKVYVVAMNRQSDPLNDFFEDDNGLYGAAYGDVSAIYQRVNTTKYKVLATRLLKTGTVSNTANDSNAAKFFNINIKTPGRFEYEEDVTVPQKRQIVMFVISRRANNDDSLGLSTELTYNCKWWFKDT